MTTPGLQSLRIALDAFMVGGDFWLLWRAVMDATSQDSVSDSEQRWFDELYELVYMAAPDPVCGDETRDGIIGANALRILIRERQLDVQPPPA